MWVVSGIFFVLWVLSVGYYLPVALIFSFFGAMVLSVTTALLSTPEEEMRAWGQRLLRRS